MIFDGAQAYLCYAVRYYILSRVPDIVFTCPDESTRDLIGGKTALTIGQLVQTIKLNWEATD